MGAESTDVRVLPAGGGERTAITDAANIDTGDLDYAAAAYEALRDASDRAITERDEARAELARAADVLDVLTDVPCDCEGFYKCNRCPHELADRVGDEVELMRAVLAEGERPAGSAPLDWIKRKHLEWAQGRADAMACGFDEWIEAEWRRDPPAAGVQSTTETVTPRALWDAISAPIEQAHGVVGPEVWEAVRNVRELLSPAAPATPESGGNDAR